MQWIKILNKKKFILYITRTLYPYSYFNNMSIKLPDSIKNL